MATILEKIQEKYPGVTDDARNIAEALGMASGVGGRGSGNIADVMYAEVTITFDSNNGSGKKVMKNAIKSSSGVTIPECTFTPAEGEEFDYWCTSSSGASGEGGKIYPGLRRNLSFSNDTTLYAIWKEAE